MPDSRRFILAGSVNMSNSVASSLPLAFSAKALRTQDSPISELMAAAVNGQLARCAATATPREARA